MQIRKKQEIRAVTYNQNWPTGLKRDRATSLLIIVAEVETGSTIHSNEWRVYTYLNDHGYIHQTVNHQKNCNDTSTIAHT